MLIGTAGVLLLIVVVVAWVGFAYLPIAIAKSRRHKNVDGVKLLAVLGIFLPFCWLIAVIWACVGEPAPAPASRRPVRVMAKSLNYDPAWEAEALDREVGREIESKSGDDF